MNTLRLPATNALDVCNPAPMGFPERGVSCSIGVFANVCVVLVTRLEILLDAPVVRYTLFDIAAATSRGKGF